MNRAPRAGSVRPLLLCLQMFRAYALFRSDPYHPSLRFKKAISEENVYSVRIGIGYRALGILEGAVITWFWIGSHGEYDRLL